MSEWQETREAIRIFGIWRVLYWHTFYRHHMRLIHRFGRHSFTFVDPWNPYDPTDRNPHWHCRWCGHREFLPTQESEPESKP